MASPGPHRALRQAVIAGACALAFWLVAVRANGFQLSPDSMSYAALARAFASGHPFTGSIFWLNGRPGHLQAVWPPLYPALIALVHLFGPNLPWSELLLSAAGTTLAAAFGVLAVARLSGRCPWAAVPIIGGSPVLLYVGGFGWSEPICLALLGLHYWVAAEIMARRADGSTSLRWLFAAEGLAVGLAFVDRYAAAPFLLTAVLLPLVLGVLTPQRSGWADTLWNTVAACLGAGLPVLPWTLAAELLTGHLGAPYVAVGAGLRGAFHMAIDTIHVEIRTMLAPTHLPEPVVRADELHFLVLTAAVAAVALLVVTLLRLRGDHRTEGLAPAAIPLAMLAVDSVLYTVVVIYLRAHYFFDSIDRRLMAPGLYPALLALLLLVTFVPWRLVREVMVLPLAAILLWHGGQAAAASLRRPELRSSLAGPWCTRGTQGDCTLFSWLSDHTDQQDMLITNAGYTINFQLHLPVRQVATYPYNPKATAADIAQWARQWLVLHPGGRVFVVLDAAAGPVGDPTAPYGSVFLRLWSGASSTVGGFHATPVYSGAAYRVFALSAAAAA